MKKLLMFTAAAFMITAPALAESESKPHHHTGMMEKIDTDKDGAISKAEFISFHEQRFAEMDTNGDGQISKEEGEAKKAQWKEKLKEKRGKRKGPEAEPVETPAEAPAEAPAETPAE